VEKGRASRTAWAVAARRAAHQLMDRPLVFEDPLAIRILPRELADKLETDPRYRSRLGTSLRAALAVRSRYAEDELRSAVARGVRQYVLLGAGLDTFAYRNPFPDVRVFEVDHPDTQAAKRRRLRDAAIEIPSTTVFVPIDFATTSLDEGLRGSGFDRERPASFAWLGVVPYLDREAIVRTIRVIASMPRGTTVVFDYGGAPSTLSWLSRFVVWRLRRRLKAIGEPIKSSFVPAEIAALLRDAGFSDVEDLNYTELNRRYLANRSDGLNVGEAMHIMKGTV
jgi:methyltransferase (TIGR00027 family)